MGHTAIGCDTDPLAVLISKVWCRDMNAGKYARKAQEVACVARTRYKHIRHVDAYPSHADDDTRRFIDYWFDVNARKQLAALAEGISPIHDAAIRNALWCAFSRLIITKQKGASLAMDVSHSRPHKVYERSPIQPIDQFERAASKVAKNCPFDGCQNTPQPKVYKADARHLPFADESIDIVLTSPPYLNAIDYLRGHRLSLVWMGHNLTQLRTIRSGNVGAEIGLRSPSGVPDLAYILTMMGVGDETPKRIRQMLARYLRDMDAVIKETARVLSVNGRAIFVVGNSMLGGTYIRNSKAIACIGERCHLDLVSARRRELPNNRRYLPPPGSSGAGKQLMKRMREEVILSFRKTL